MYYNEITDYDLDELRSYKVDEPNPDNLTVFDDDLLDMSPGQEEEYRNSAGEDYSESLEQNKTVQ